MTISPEYAEELGRQIDELEAENERLRDGIARLLFDKAMSGHAQWDEMTEPNKEDWRVRADEWMATAPVAPVETAPTTVWRPIDTAPKGPTISVARKGGQRDDGSTYWYQAVGHYDPNLGHFHEHYGELYGEPEVWAHYPENPERCAAQAPSAFNTGEVK